LTGQVTCVVPLVRQSHGFSLGWACGVREEHAFSREEHVRAASRGLVGVSTDSLCPRRAPGPGGLSIVLLGVVVLDIVYVLAVIAVFAVVSLVAKGVEKL
jgi:hypothetical protein